MVSIPEKDRYSTVRRCFLFLSILFIYTVSIATVFGEDKDSKLPPGACQAASSQSVLINGKNVISYVPKGSWWQQAENIAVVNVEPSTAPPRAGFIQTPSAVVNSCASNSATGETVCTVNNPDVNNKDVYVISGTQIKSRLRSAATGMAFFSGSVPFWCMTCEVSMDPIRNRALIGLNYSPMAEGYQILNLDNRSFGTAFPSLAPDMGTGVNQISEGILLDPIQNRILSPNENSNFEIIQLAKGDNGDKDNDDQGKKNGDKDNKDKGTPAYFENTFTNTFIQFGSAAEDCAKGIALGAMASNPNSTDPSDRYSHIYLADLSRTRFTPGTPSGPWGAPKDKGKDKSSQIQILWDSVLTGNGTHQGANGIAIAQDTHMGIVTGEWGADSVTAISLDNDDDGPPSIKDWVTCRISGGFMTGLDPHAVTAYRSPNNNDAIGLVANFPGDMLAWIDLKKMLDLPRIQGASGKGKHVCADPFLPQPAVLRLIPVSSN